MDRKATTLGALNEMRKKSELCDVKLQVGGAMFNVHRNVLAAASPCFKAMFCGGFRESKTNSNDLVPLQDLDGQAFEVVLDFIYGCDLQLSEVNVGSVLAAVHLFQMEDAVTLCENFMLKNKAESTYLRFLQLAETYDLKKFLDCGDYFKVHFVSISLTSDFKELSKEKLCAILNDDLLCIDGQEIEVFRAALRWLQHSPERLEQHLQEVMNCVKFHLIPIKLLTDEVLRVACVKAPSHQASASTDGNVPQHFRQHAMPMLSMHKPITFTHG